MRTLEVCHLIEGFIFANTSIEYIQDVRSAKRLIKQNVIILMSMDKPNMEIWDQKSLCRSRR